MPGEGEAELRREFHDIRDRLPAEFAKRVGDPDFFVCVHASEQLPGSTLAAECRELLAKTGKKAELVPFPAGCDQFVFIEAGIDCLLVGPGDMRQAHTADEYVEISQLLHARAFYRAFLEKRLRPPGLYRSHLRFRFRKLIARVAHGYKIKKPIFLRDRVYHKSELFP